VKLPDQQITAIAEQLASVETSGLEVRLTTLGVHPAVYLEVRDRFVHRHMLIDRAGETRWSLDVDPDADRMFVESVLPAYASSRLAPTQEA
jgi:hypothetical protein